MSLVSVNGELVHISALLPRQERVKSSPWGNTLRNYFMQDVMVDLETGGTVAGCAIFSIGAVYFDPITGDLGDEKYIIVRDLNQEQAKIFGLHYSKSTMQWWSEQSAEARSIFGPSGDHSAPDFHPDAVMLDEAIIQLRDFVLGGPRRNVRVWGNGADFDNPIVAVAARQANVQHPYAPFNGRCYRTIKGLCPDIKIERAAGIHHNALADAKNQALHMARVVQRLGIRPN
jgi:hypothetical protein